MEYPYFLSLRREQKIQCGIASLTFDPRGTKPAGGQQQLSLITLSQLFNINCFIKERQVKKG
jgi:hypothetical protein